jgi:hypothetical protein
MITRLLSYNSGDGVKNLADLGNLSESVFSVNHVIYEVVQDLSDFGKMKVTACYVLQKKRNSKFLSR